jgi:hypothetical protein
MPPSNRIAAKLALIILREIRNHRVIPNRNQVVISCAVQKRLKIGAVQDADAKTGQIVERRWHFQTEETEFSEFNLRL